MRKGLKLFFISADKYPPYRVDISVLFGKEFVRKGHRIDWVLQSDKSCDKSYNTHWSGCRVMVARTDNGVSKLARVRKHVFGIAHDVNSLRQIRRGQYDAVQVKDKFLSAIFALIVAKLKRVKYVYWLSFPFPESSIYEYKTGAARYPWFYLVRGVLQKLMLYRVILPASDGIFVQSEQMKKDVVKYGIDEEKICSVPMGSSLEEMKNIGSDVNIRLGDEHIITYIGTLVKQRKIDFLIRVLVYVVQDCPNTKLYLVGEGEDQADRDIIYNEALRNRVEDKVIITGFLPRDKALQYVATADVCVSPFYPTPILNSTSPTKLVEYMVMGKPVVANDHPEQRDLLHESGAGLCVSYNEREFASAIVEILKNPQMANEMGRLGRQYIEKERTYEKIANDVEQEYMRICNF